MIGYGGHFVFQSSANNKGEIMSFSVMATFNFEAGVKGQIQHLEKIPWP